ncbi:hypothetical protein GJ744_002933 [Endocarpon pusillum]|uniref:Uncharacterized protein n=1 Tax=Endocarpon pusillum TaxID=364733 RepID=A0A8H7AEZ4_9EURO|nr:hypothetical protein GJ744_002933 [Endocarpon pusillum]
MYATPLIGTSDVPLIHDPTCSGVRYISEGRPLTQLPVLTTFVGSLVHNAPFRVSIHSWEQPKASRMLDSLTRPGSSVTFEARVYIDGLMVASSIFNQRAMWPHVIGAFSNPQVPLRIANAGADLCSQMDREGYQEPLRFPPFHQEILHASSWDAGQLLGRIRVVITEGFSRETDSPHNNLKHSFVRIKDVLAFSFQHAPMHILEFSGIAWPNPGMWMQVQSRSSQGPVSGGQRPFVCETKEDEDAHAHSPRRPSHQGVCIPEGFNSRSYPDFDDYWANQSMPPPPNRTATAAWNQSALGEPNLIRPNGLLADPFLDVRGLGTANTHRENKKSSEDTPMPDVPSSEASRNLSGMTGISCNQKDPPSAIIASHEAIMNQLVEALSPLKSDYDGPHNTTNTPSSGRVFSKPSAAAQARAVSRQASSPEKGETVEIPDSTGRKAKASMNIISANPGGPVQSKKEGEDNKENMPETRVIGAEFTRRSSLSAHLISTKSVEKLERLSESKRKRPLEEVPTCAHHNSVDDLTSSSPSKKVSKMASAEALFKGQSPHTPDRGRDVSGGVPFKPAAEGGAPASDDDDAQAEHQLQASLQRATEDIISLLHPEKDGNAGNGADCGTATVTLDALPLEVQSSVAAPASFSHKHSEQNGRFRHADLSQSATRIPTGVHFNVTQEEDGSRLRELNGEATRMSSSSSTINGGGTNLQASSGLENDLFGTNQSSSSCDENPSAKDCSNSLHSQSHTVNEATVDLQVASQKSPTRTTSSTVPNPWSAFADSDLDRFTKRTLSSVFSFGSRPSKQARTGAEEVEKNDDLKCCPILEMETTEQGQRCDRSELQKGDEDQIEVDETSHDGCREVQDASADSFVTAREGPAPDREERVDADTDQPNAFFGGLHPSRMILVSNREAPPPTELPAESRSDMAVSTWKATGANTMPLSTQQESAQIQKAKKQTKQITSNNARSSQSEGSFTRDCPKVEIRFLVEGIESLKKRYTYLNSTAIDSKEWSFAWQEITAIFRTPFSYHYDPWHRGVSVQLKTDFKMFRFWGTFTKARAKEAITKKAVLYVIDGPFFFKQAAPALHAFCRTNGLAAPLYTYRRHPDGTFGCSVRVGNQSAVFGDNAEGWTHRKHAKEDTAKMAMNALYHEGVPMDLGAIPDARPAGADPHAEPQVPNKRKAPVGSLWEAGQRTSCRIQGRVAKHTEGPPSSIEDREVNTIEPDTKDGIQHITTGSVLRLTKSSERTRAGLAKVLEEVLERQERVMVICDYLQIQKPEYWMEGSFGGKRWFARFLSEHPSHKVGHTLIAPTVVDSLNGLQDCARRVEEKLFEKVYSGEIYLGDNSAKFPDPAMDSEWRKEHSANLPPSKKRRLEMDEGRLLEEINRRHYHSDNIALPPSANSVPLGVPALEICGMDEDTGYESEDELPRDAMVLAHPEDSERRGPQSHLIAAPQCQQVRESVAASVSTAQAASSRFASKQFVPANTAIDRPQDAANRCIAQKGRGLDGPANLLPSGEHRYVSPPPFLDTPTRLPKMGPAIVVKPEPQD